MADIYDGVAPSVALVYDITLRSTGPGGPQAVEQPEGNGSGFVWDKGQCGGRPSLLGLAVLLPLQLAASAAASSATGRLCPCLCNWRPVLLPLQLAVPAAARRRPANCSANHLQMATS